MHWKYIILDESLFSLSWRKGRVEQDLQKDQSRRCSSCSDICLHFHRSRWDVTQKGWAYLCAVAQHPVRYVKLWTFGMVRGGDDTPLALGPAEPATADCQLLITSSSRTSIFPCQAPFSQANPIIQPCYGPIPCEFCLLVQYALKQARKSRR